MITKTVVKTIPEFLVEEIERTNPRNIHIKKGPHKSPKIENKQNLLLHCFSSLILSSVK